MEGVERFAIPTPFSVGRVNCYLFAGAGPTLLDPGPATTEAETALRSALERAGYALADVEQVLVTHPHIDHFGIASRVAEAADARVLAHADAVDRLADPLGHFDREQAFFGPFLASMGVPEGLVDAVVELPESYVEFQEPVEVDRALTDGDRVDAGVDLSVVHTPGHAPGSVSFVADGPDAAFTGDHVLPGITPNPLLTLAPNEPGTRTRSLPTYIESLRTLRAVGATVGYGGHGDPMPDLQGRIDETIEHHERRKERIADLLADRGSATAYQLMGDLFPDLPATEVFAGMSEVIGHLDLLEDEGRVEVVERDGVRRYELS